MSDFIKDVKIDSSNRKQVDSNSNGGSGSSSVVLPFLAIRNVVLLPNTLTPLFVGRDKSIEAVNLAFKNNLSIFISTQINNSDEIVLDRVYKVGVIAKIIHMSKTGDTGVRILVDVKQRANLISFSPDISSLKAAYEIDDNSLHFAEVAPFNFVVESKPKIDALRLSIVKVIKEYAATSGKIAEDVVGSVVNLTDNTIFHDTVVSVTPIDFREKQKMLESIDAEKNLSKVFEFMRYEIEVFNTEKEINEKVKEKMKKDQKKYYLNEQIKVINDELVKISPGEERAEYQKYINAAKKKKLPKYAMDKINEEVARLKASSGFSSESGLIKAYLDFLISLPWHDKSVDNKDIKNAKDALDAAHYGLKDVKDRVLEYIAVQSRTSKPKGQILCLYGPPGVGKTSLAKSIAEAMGKKYAKVSLGGLRDEAEIRGHRKTYVGAFAGKILNAMKSTGVINPVILLDEIDKVGSSYRGDPVSALLEVLDPEQNKEFQDHYLEVPFDLSHVTFIATSNSLDISAPLLDRMEVINITGYTEIEKQQICKNHIVPKVFSENEIKDGELSINDAAMLKIIRYYTRESGVRGLAKQVTKIARKSVKKIVTDKKQKLITVNEKNLKDFLGVERYKYGVLEEDDKVGLVTGLAYTESGGDILKIESVKSKSGSDKPELKTTGKLGDVMKESIMTAFSYVQSKADKFKIDPEEFKKYNIHIHFPEGAVPKDGPSAGVAITLSFVSLFLNKKVRRDVGMTGEITLMGKVLPIGGLKEKLMAAVRGGLKTIFIPEENTKDLEEIPTEIKSALEIIPIKSIDEVIKRSFVK